MSVMMRVNRKAGGAPKGAPRLVRGYIGRKGSY